MSLIRLNADFETASIDRTRRVLRAAPCNTAPVIIMIHGYKYDPGIADASPHDLIFSIRHPHSWPIGLGICESSATLGISFGWRARGQVRHAFAAADRAGAALAQVIGLLQSEAPARPVHIIGHSMGADVALSALLRAPAHAVSRVILLAAATFQSRARQALATPAGRTAELFHVTGRENALFDALFEWLVPAPVRGDRALRRSLDAPNALTLRLDCPRSREALAGLHLNIARPFYPVCHWSGYTTPGALAAYAQLIHLPGVLSLRRMRQALSQPAPRPLPALGKPGMAWLTGRKAAEPLTYEPAN